MKFLDLLIYNISEMPFIKTQNLNNNFNHNNLKSKIANEFKNPINSIIGLVPETNKINSSMDFNKEIDISNKNENCNNSQNENETSNYKTIR